MSLSRRVFVLGGHTTSFIGKKHPDFIWKGHPEFGKRNNPTLEETITGAVRGALDGVFESVRIPLLHRADDRKYVACVSSQVGCAMGCAFCRTGAAGLHGESLKVRLAAPPVEGRANEALVAWLAKEFSVPARQVRLVRGEKSREKVVEISGSARDPEILLDNA